MKWFRHPTNDRRDSFIQAIIRNLGHKFVAAWYCLVETITEKYERNGEDFHVTMHVNDWLRELYLHHNAKDRLFKLLELASSHGRVTYELLDSNLKIALPGIVQIADEYTKKLQKKSGENPLQRKIKDKEKPKSLSAPEGAEGGKRQTGKSNAAWVAYSDAMKQIHGVEPERNVKVNSLLCKIVDRVGDANAELLVRHYVSHPNKFYASRGHQLDFALRDAEALMLEIKKGKTNESYQQSFGGVFRSSSVRTGNERQIQQGEISALRLQALESDIHQEGESNDNDNDISQ